MIDTSAFQSREARIYMRGVGSGALTPAVGVYVDGVYHGDFQIMNVIDPERVEVLRGPQGTLYGKNTVGGLVNMITQKPDFDGLHGYTQLTAGNYDTFNTMTSINVPLVDETLAARFTFATRTSDGYMKNKFHSGDVASDDRLLGGRASFLWQPAEDWEFLLTASTTTQRLERSAPKLQVDRRADHDKARSGLLRSSWPVPRRSDPHGTERPIGGPAGRLHPGIPLRRSSPGSPRLPPVLPGRRVRA